MASKRLKKKRAKQQQAATVKKIPAPVLPPISTPVITVKAPEPPKATKPKREYVKRAEQTYDYKALAKMSDDALDKIARAKRRVVMQKLEGVKKDKFYIDSKGRIVTPSALQVEQKIKKGVVPAIRMAGYKRVKPKDIEKRKKRIDEILTYERYLRDKTSTLEGARELTEKIEKVIPGYKKLTADQRRDFWEAYNTVKDNIKNNNLGSEQILNDFLELYLNTNDPRTPEEIVKDLYEKAYEAATAKEQAEIQTSVATNFDEISKIAYKKQEEQEEEEDGNKPNQQPIQPRRNSSRRRRNK